MTDHLKLPVDVQLLAIYPHAHYLGKQIEAWADLPGGSRRPLLKINDWNIDWQATYSYKNPVALPAGTSVGMRITYDNSSRIRAIRIIRRNASRMAIAAKTRWVTSGCRCFPGATPAPIPGCCCNRLRCSAASRSIPRISRRTSISGPRLQALNRHDEAIAYLSRAARIRPSSAMARNNLAVSLLMTDRIDEAIAGFREALLLDPGYYNARFNLARALAAKGDAAAALTEYLTCLQSSPDDRQANEFVARLYVSMGKVAESVPHFRKAARLAPHDSDLATNLGVALAITGDLPGAIAAFEDALQSNPRNETARQNLSRARAALKKR